jgi:hypothetical protein
MNLAKLNQKCKIPLGLPSSFICINTTCSVCQYFSCYLVQKVMFGSVKISHKTDDHETNDVNFLFMLGKTGDYVNKKLMP